MMVLTVVMVSRMVQKEVMVLKAMEALEEKLVHY